MLNKKEKTILDNHTKALIKLADTVGQIIDYLKDNDSNFNIEEGKLLNEKEDD